ncbi:MAG: hypothetical protein EGP14_06410 [SAR202 cluster bacterium]|nr:MAG: hypothetical protein EGP14_06410 [SAR202 cluster bacterium]
MIRRVARTQPGKAWEVAGYLTKICEAYESNGRNKAQIYIGGQGLPGTPNTVIAEWIQDTIEPNWPTKTQLNQIGRLMFQIRYVRIMLKCRSC